MLDLVACAGTGAFLLGMTAGTEGVLPLIALPFVQLAVTIAVEQTTAESGGGDRAPALEEHASHE